MQQTAHERVLRATPSPAAIRPVIPALRSGSAILPGAPAAPAVRGAGQSGAPGGQEPAGQEPAGQEPAADGSMPGVEDAAGAGVGFEPTVAPCPTVWHRTQVSSPRNA
jgi:hypothetical protein